MVTAAVEKPLLALTDPRALAVQGGMGLFNVFFETRSFCIALAILEPTVYVDQVDFEFTKIYLSLPPKSGD